MTSIEHWYNGRTLVFGHRGASAYAPMNTIPAFELAAAQGAHGIELDVWLTQDREVIILHDVTVNKTTDGSGRVTDMTLAQVKDLDAGGWFNDTFRQTRIPTLDEVFEAVGHKLYINVEIKTELTAQNFASELAQQTAGLEEVVAGKIAHFGLQDRVIVSSFDPFALTRFRKHAPNVAIGFLYERTIADAAQPLLDQFKPAAYHPHHTVIDAAYMEKARLDKMRVHTWTVNDAARALQLRDLGVDIIMSDYPDVMLQALAG